MFSSQLRPTPAPSDCEGYECKSNSGAAKSLCLSCGSTYCDACWDRQGPHRPGKVGIDGLPHEKTDKQIYDRLRVIFEPPDYVVRCREGHQWPANIPGLRPILCTDDRDEATQYRR